MILLLFSLSHTQPFLCAASSSLWPGLSHQNLPSFSFFYKKKKTAQDFVEELTSLRELVKDRAAKRLEEYQLAQGVDMTDEISPQSTDAGTLVRSPDDLNNKMMTATTEINLLIEIVSATDLPIADIVSTDPYVVVYLGNQKIHKTGYISKT